MARQKKDSVNEEVELLNEDEMELSEANEEAEEMELDEEDSEEEEAEAKPAKRKARKPKKKEPEGLAAQLLKNSADAKPEPKLKDSEDAEKEFAMGAKEADAEASSEGTEVPEETEAPKKARRPRSSTEEKNLSVAMESALEAMTSHWAKAKEATDALVANLERVKKDLEEVKESSAGPLQKIIDQSREKQAVASRVMFALSLGAIIFSFVSLTLSQSVRGQLLSLTQSHPPTTRYQAATPPAPVAPVTSASSVIPSAVASNGADAAKALAKIPGPRRAKRIK